MSAALEPGMWVEVISPGDELWGRVFQVEEVGDEPTCPCGFCGDTQGANLREDGVPRIPGEIDWCHCELRPIYRPNSEFLQDLLTNIPADLKEDA